MNQRHKPRVIYENRQILVVDKPAGMVVNRAESVKGETLQDWIGAYGKWPIADSKTFRSGMVHRLDKDTSGVMVVAKTQEVFENLQRQFRQRQVEKTYVALLHGKLEPREGMMRLPVRRSKKDRKKFQVMRQGRMSETGWKVIEYLEKEGERFSLAELYPKTGRTHQLRVHLRHLGHPIVGDSQYLGKKRARKDAQWCKRQFLHAKRLCVFIKGKQKCFEAKLAKDLQRVLDDL